MGVGPALAHLDGDVHAVAADLDIGRIDVAARVALDGGEAEREQLPDHRFFLQLLLQLAQPTALTEREVAEAPQLVLREAWRVDMRQQIGAVPMVVVMGDHHADLVERGGPRELATMLFLGLRRQLRVQTLRQ